MPHAFVITDPWWRYEVSYDDPAASGLSPPPAQETNPTQPETDTTPARVAQELASEATRELVERAQDAVFTPPAPPPHYEHPTEDYARALWRLHDGWNDTPPRWPYDPYNVMHGFSLETPSHEAFAVRSDEDREAATWDVSFGWAAPTAWGMLRMLRGQTPSPANSSSGESDAGTVTADPDAASYLSDYYRCMFCDKRIRDSAAQVCCLSCRRDAPLGTNMALLRALTPDAVVSVEYQEGEDPGVECIRAPSWLPREDESLQGRWRKGTDGWVWQRSYLALMGPVTELA